MKQLKAMLIIIAIVSLAMAIASYRSLSLLQFIFFGSGWLFNSLTYLLLIYVIEGEEKK